MDHWRTTQTENLVVQWASELSNSALEAAAPLQKRVFRHSLAGFDSRQKNPVAPSVQATEDGDSWRSNDSPVV